MSFIEEKTATATSVPTVSTVSTQYLHSIIYSIYTVSTVTTVSTQYLQYLQYLRTSLLAAALPLLAGVGLDLGAVVRVAEQLARAVEEPGEALGDEL